MNMNCTEKDIAEEPVSGRSASHEAKDNKKRRVVISVVGPTASGKSSLAVSLAKKLIERGEKCEIINADAYQMYKDMNIGTAKTTEEEQGGIKHHLLDIFEPNESVSAAQFQKIARATIFELQKNNIRPILVGGSGLYARAAIDDIKFPATDPKIREKIEKLAEQIGAEALFDMLRQKDPAAAEKMDERNVRRTVRALEVIEITGKSFSSTLPQYKYLIPTVQIGLDVSREQLDENVAKRTRKMIESGLVDEVKNVRTRMCRTSERALGYMQIIDYLDGKCTLEQAETEITQRTRRLARKQMCWFGRDPRICWLDSTDKNLVEKALGIVDQADARDCFEPDTGGEKPVRRHLGDV